MLSREGKQTDRGAVGAEFIGYNRRRREALLLQEFPHQPNCRPSVPAGLNQEIQDFALTVHGTPEIELPPSNYDDHLVQVPAFGRSWPPTLNPPRIGPTEFQDPSSNCLIRDVETTLGKQVLNVPIAQRETAIEPDGMLDDDRWKAVTTVGYLAHPETLKHRPCRSHAVNVTMPPETIVMHLNVRHPPKSPRHCFRKCGTIAVPADLAFAGEAWSSVHDALPLVTADSDIAPEELARLLRAAFFSPSDDADADSWETQLTRFEEDALHMSLRLLCSVEEARQRTIADAVWREIFWLMPRDRTVTIVVRGGKVSVDIGPVCTEAATDAATGEAAQ